MNEHRRSLSARGVLFANGGKKRVGRVQLQIRRALIAADGRPVQIGDLLPRCFPAARNYPRWMRKSVHRALPRFAVPLERTNTRGRPIMWAPNPELMRLIEAHTENPKNSAARKPN